MHDAFSTVPRVGVLIQARMSSVRLPGKMMMELGGVPLIDYVYGRCLSSKQVDIVGVITSEEPSDDPLWNHCKERNIEIFRGSLHDVLGRYVSAAEAYDLDYVVRVCGDSPFVDIHTMDGLIEQHVSEGYDYLSIKNNMDGFFFEIIKTSTLISIEKRFHAQKSREHVTTEIRSNLNQYHCKIIDVDSCPPEAKQVSLTIDNQDDLNVANMIVKNGLSGYAFTSADVLSILMNRIISNAV